jgi:predicted DNA-binding protein with PD1-like motif
MKYSEAKQGRIFIIRLEDGDILHECIEAFALKHGIRAAALIALGGADTDSTLVVGPAEGRSPSIVAMERVLANVHEVTGVGTIFPEADGTAILHMHLACGREGETITGCVRRGVRVWHVVEVVLWELVDTTGRRLKDAVTGFKLLEP